MSQLFLIFSGRTCTSLDRPLRGVYDPKGPVSNLSKQDVQKKAIVFPHMPPPPPLRGAISGMNSAEDKFIFKTSEILDTRFITVKEDDK